MLDGTDVDAQISKKRAHKNIMAEALLAENKNKFKLTGRKRKPAAKKPTTDEVGSTTQVGSHNDSELQALAAELGGSGYIIESGNVIAIDLPALDSVNKMALNVIQAQVRDYFDENMDEDANFHKLRGNLMNVLERNASKPMPTRKTSNLSVDRPTLADGGKDASRKVTTQLRDDAKSNASKVAGSKMTEQLNEMPTEGSV
mmetsp:Transcript_24476/g.30496  ORF Transcript_24476/g.30496 Transcript_24476/m.30496 type:complete len:201 (+) Transcript_24476:737-1339(+)